MQGWKNEKYVTSNYSYQVFTFGIACAGATEKSTGAIAASAKPVEMQE